MDPLLGVRSLRVEATSSVGTIVAVDRFDLDLYPGDVMGLIGESGSGESGSGEKHSGPYRAECPDHPGFSLLPG